MGDGSGQLVSNPDLKYAQPGTDQMMLADPSDGIGGPDGYTRWFNYPEFTTGGMPLFSFTQGIAASVGFNGTATANAYKYYADGLGLTEDAWTWLSTVPGVTGMFASGASNIRNFYLRFPDGKDTVFAYAVTGNWDEGVADGHPSNTPEAVACDINDESDLWYVDPIQNGGNLIFDISLFDWEHLPSAIIIESTVLSSVYEFTVSDMIPIGGGTHYSTWHVEIPADDVGGLDGNEFWVCARYDEFNYKNDFGTTNLTGDDPLTALFRYDLSVSDTPPIDEWIEVLTPNGGEEWAIGSDHEITWDSENVTGTVFIEYSKSDFEFDVLTISTDEPDDGSYMWLNIPDTPSQTARVRVSSTDNPVVNDTSNGDFRIYSLDCNDAPFWLLEHGDLSCATPGEFGWQYIIPYQEFYWDIKCWDSGSGDPPPELPEDPEPIEGGIIHHFAIQFDEHPSSGYAIAVNEICYDGCDVFIDYTKYIPGPGVPTDPVITKPWAVYAIELPPVYCWWSWYFTMHEEIYN